MSQFRKATRSQAKLRLALIGPAGSGKTFSALSLATHLVPGGRIAVIDTECGSAELYAKRFSFDTMDLMTHSPLEYVTAIEAAEAEGYDVIIVDSLSHAWIGKDGALEQKGKAEDRGGNSWTAWRTVTPKHNRLVDKIISCKAHLIATIRAKTAYVQEYDEKTKKNVIKKLGMEAVQRDGLEFEFGLVGDMDYANTFTVSKTRLDGAIFPGDVFERPGEALGTKIRNWLNDGSPVAAAAAAVPATAPNPETAQFVERMAAPVESSATVEPRVEPLAEALDENFRGYCRAMVSTTTVDDLDAIAAGPAKPAKGTPEHAKATEIYKAHRRALLTKAKPGVAA